jgi:hypothetical protein
MTATMLEPDVDWQTLEDMPIACEMKDHPSGAYNHAGDAEWYMHWTCCDTIRAICDPYRRFLGQYMDWFAICGTCKASSLAKDMLRFTPIRD